jgi:hypothetical protein
MPCNYQSQKRYNTKAIDFHLLSIGLIPRSSKWNEVWQRKKHKFLIK